MEITARPAETSMQARKPSPSLSKQSEIVKMLTKFSLRRQAAVNPETLALFAADLEHLELADLESALKELSLRPRRDGETAFPDLATVLEAVRYVRAERSSRRALEKENERIAHFHAHPEFYEADEEIKEKFHALAEKMDMPKTKPIIPDPVMVCCPHCHGMLPLAKNLRFWSPQELRNYAGVLEEVQAIADRNRAMAKLPLGDVVEGIA